MDQQTVFTSSLDVPIDGASTGVSKYVEICVYIGLNDEGSSCQPLWDYIDVIEKGAITRAATAPPAQVKETRSSKSSNPGRGELRIRPPLFALGFDGRKG